MATFVLVHGGGHGGWCWQTAAAILRSIGHQVYTPTLTGLGERRHLLSPGTDLATHVEDVCAVLQYEDLRDVILIGHSYGGMVVTGVADQAAERIGRLVYLDAAIPRSGESLLDVSPGLAGFARGVRIVDGVALGLWPDAAALTIYGLRKGPLAQWALERLTPHPWRCFEQALSLDRPQAVAALPRAIVNCRETLARRPVATRGRWLDAGFVREIDAAHDMMLTEPQLTADILAEIARHDFG